MVRMPWRAKWASSGVTAETRGSGERAASSSKIWRGLRVAAEKTATASALIQWAVAKGRRVVFIVHRREIVLDTARRIPGAGVVMAGHPRTDAPVQVCSIQTLVAREAHPPADLLIWDEAHHCAADTYRDIAAQYPGGEVLVVSHGGVIRAAQRAIGWKMPKLPNLSGSWFVARDGVLSPGEAVHLLAGEHTAHEAL